jgi:hypothetical protein
MLCCHTNLFIRGAMFYPSQSAGISGPPDYTCYSPIRRKSQAVARQNDSFRSAQIDIGWTRGSSWAKAKSHAREMHTVVVRRDAPHALDPLALLGACSHSREIGFRKADARDRLRWVGRGQFGVSCDAPAYPSAYCRH